MQLPRFFSLSFLVLISYMWLGCSDSNQTINPQDPRLEKQIKELYQYAQKLSATAKMDSALIVLKEAAAKAYVLKNNRFIAKVLLEMASLKNKKGDFNDAVIDLYEILSLSNPEQDTLTYSVVYFDLGLNFFKMNVLKKAESYMLEAKKGFEQLQRKRGVAKCFNILAGIKKKEEKIDSAQFYLLQSMELFRSIKDSMGIALALNNVAELLSYEQKYEDALLLYKQSGNYNNRKSYNHEALIRLNNIAACYQHLNQTDSFVYYSNKTFEYCQKIPSKGILLDHYKQKVAFYYANNQLDSLKRYSDKAFVLNNLMKENASDKIVEQLNDKFEKEIELLNTSNQLQLSEKEKIIAQRNVVISLVLMVLALLSAAVIFYIARLKRQKQQLIHAHEKAKHQQEKVFLETENKLKQLELEQQQHERLQLEKELDFKGKELFKFSMNLKEKNAFVQELEALFDQLKMNKIPDPAVLKNINILLQQSNHEHQAVIHQQIEQINASFNFKLKSLHPKLKDDDLHLASLLLLNLSSKEIANILEIEPKSVDMKRYRLKKKLELDSKTDMRSYLAQV